MNKNIVTWSKSTNYGTCFQAYALYRYIKSLGYDVCILKMFRAPYHIKCVLNWIYLKQKSFILIVKDMNKKSKNNSQTVKKKRELLTNKQKINNLNKLREYV